MANTNLNPNPGIVAVGMNQGAPVSIGAQKASSIQQYDAAGNLVQVATTQPALALLAEIVCADTADNYDLIVPFACKAVDALFNSTGTAATSGDTWKISTVTLAGASADATAAQAIVAATNSITRPVALNPTNALIEAGGTLRITTVKGGSHVAGIAKVWLIPTAL